MNILLFLIPLSLLLLVAAVWAFVWAVNRDQFEDLDTPAIDILREDPHERPRAPAGTVANTTDDHEARDPDAN
jgi:cbb3-type cytochrome oxidase maturation protein